MKAGTYVAERKKQVATPKKKVEKTTISTVPAWLYLRYTVSKTQNGKIAKAKAPIIWDQMFTCNKCYNCALGTQIGISSNIPVSLCFDLRLPRHLPKELVDGLKAHSQQ